MKAKCWEKEWKKKLIEPHCLEEWSTTTKKEKKTIASLNGSFDLLHAGHLHILYEASLQADILIVALNSDASVKSYKSFSRPIIPLDQRLQLISALECVNFVTWFNEIDPREVLKKIRPNVHVNGEEYGYECVEAETVLSLGARLHLVKRIGEGNLSTSEIMAKVKKQCDL